MKIFGNFLAVSMVLFATWAQAEIKNSNLEARHQKLIEDEVLNSCKLNGVLEQKSLTAREIVVDQGVRDWQYDISLELKVGVDQYKYDAYKVDVQSMFYSMYDHNAKEWGAYSVDAVVCQKIK